MKVIAIINQKGGVGKTTTTINLADMLTHRGYEVLGIDLDQTGNFTKTAGVSLNNGDSGIAAIYKDRDFDPGEVVVESPWGYKVAPASAELSASIEFMANNRIYKEMILKDALPSFVGDADYVLIDCPPSLNTATVNAINAASLILVPFDPGIYSMEGIQKLRSLIAEVRQDDVSIRIVPTLKDNRDRDVVEFVEDTSKVFGELLLSTTIHRNTDLNKANIEGKPIRVFNPNSTGARDYTSLMDELLSLDA